MPTATTSSPRPPTGILGRLHAVPVEAWVWAAGLAALACADPNGPGLLRLCLFDALGWPYCPGCGLGHAVAHLFRGEFAASFAAHPLGLFAVAVLAGRVARLAAPAFAPTPLTEPR